MTVRKRNFGLNHVERAVIVAQWRREAVTANLHALIGGDGVKLVNEVGRVFYVVLGACAQEQCDPECTDLRILRGAVNALHDQAEEEAIDETRRAGILSGLHACERLLPLLSQRALSDAAVDMHTRLRVGDVRYTDFQHLIERKAA